ncbi:MAG TPA: Asp-tRNA(Asn)/Glu-tRNA(Gln) amidotransferase subunit GatA [Methanothermobacter sp.]|jgi:aspartyl-tRNA(Asn)/glutamyl-tRNA(Gln) amidotransferase subunit A|uniref:Glutamyl-tRNA(Gln) amidotransferase subunit A n=1 Tax=Methanothermobacter tenebrarum TaxID=680118 RepID=A0ABN6PCT1_9EURY|nr:Asp-tRNA(Asn)/Glu-tRNA(Gln) amidotransferase subunit GatA [Methanothermobacter tenebrarum]MDI6882569.1 Asp-tRNA(Asn)/Glu-tRNA(Gln) amidotransferase subunit GatA [Methanothermobacter sp.]MDX9693861.1 Asp-tRNA(Asn)/Glu-tRNA(Gln) amidotransferase subunit GatA [Methanothermobacter sp.]BDH78684.1 aspartyl/glutamyl-tRNA amidotransferase subunit A [Methanothermobacter tenebrarum]HHW16359.1 Asp-tRNA(Asn)/Glu-tRNA(Gln) amidotransferase subunit GatA [Methanothermobacter sp.]HOQ19831.1 Asp-tRNA(Asn)/G
MDIKSKVEAIKDHELTAEENVENFIETIKEKNPRINAFIEVNREHAIKKAAEIDSRISKDEKVGRLAGLVIGIKSNINVKDFMVSAASKTLENYRGSYDATVIKRIKREDGIIIGMTNMDEFAAGSSTETSYFGVTDNPAAEGRIPGGSSGGSAAAIAAGMCDLTLGSDTGGSIRNPASHCGVYGFKPTYGLVSRQGLLDLAMSFDQIGPLSNDLYGISLLLDVISGYDPKDPTTIKTSGTSLTRPSNKKGSDLTFGIVKEFQEVTDDPIVDIIEDTINLLREEGYNVVELPFKYIDLCLPTYYLINYVEFFSATRKYDGRKYGYKIEDVCGEEVLRRIQIGSYISQKEFSGKYYRRALQARSLIRKEIEKVLKNVDIILGPTVPKLPHKIGTTLKPMEMYSYDILTVIANLAGIPAASMKIGKVKGIPIGLQLQAKPLEDWKIMKAMLEIESILKGRG